MSVNPGSRSRRPPGGGYVGPPHQQPFLRHNPPAAMLPLSNPTAQPTQAHMMQVGYGTQGQQGQQGRRALLQGPIMPHHNTQRPNASQMGTYQHMYHPMMPPQPHAAMGLAHYAPYQPQQIYSAVPPPSHPPYPVSTVRAQHGNNRTKPPKKGVNAIAIVDPDTKAELDVTTLTKGVSSTPNVTISNDTTTTATTAIANTTEQSSIDETKRKMFKEQMQELSTGATPSTEHRPNALISSPSTERHTAVPSTTNYTRVGVTIKSEPSPLLPPDSITKPSTDTKSISFTPTDTKLVHANVSSNIKPTFDDTKSTPADTKIDTKSTPADTKINTKSTPPDTKIDTKSTPADSKIDTKSTIDDTKSLLVVDTESLPADTKSVTVDTDPADTTVESSVSKSVDSDSDIKSVVSDSPPVDLSSTQEETIQQVVPPAVTNISERHPKAAGLLPTPPPSEAINVTPEILEEIMSNSTKMDSSSSSILSSQTTTTVSDIDRSIVDKSSTTGGGGELSQEELSDDVSCENNETDIPNGHVSNKDHDMFKDPQGRYIYKRDFLLQYSGLNLSPPVELKKFEILSVNAGHRSVVNMQKSPQQGYNSRPGKNVKIIDHHPSRIEKVELQKAENRWKRSEEKTDSEDDETAKLFRKFQGILNKLTPQKFKDLAERARELDISTEERLKGCIDKIFSKALEEPNFSVAYAHLCRVLSFIKVEVVKMDESGEETVRETTFRRELLTRCQKEFEKDKRDDEDREVKLKAIEEATPEEKSLKEAELVQWENKIRKRSLGNIRFIGELFKLKMLSESIMHECIVRLLRSTSDEDALECFSRLITTTGKELDHQQAKVRLDRYFERINEIIEKKKISSRIRFMLQDVQEMRRNDWVPRKQETLKTIDQIHHEAEMEAIQEKEMLRAMQPVPGKQYSRDDRKKGGKDDYAGSGRKGDKGSAAIRRDSTPDLTRITALGFSRKEKTAPTLGPGPSLRPGGGLKSRNQGTSPVPSSSGSTTPVESKAPLKGPQRSSSSGTKRQNSSGSTSSRNSQQSTKRSLTNPDEKTEALKSITDFFGAPQVPGGGTPSPTLVKKSIKDKLDEETIERKSATIVDELAQNGDYKEAIECVIELESPGLLYVFVRSAVNHSLEKSSQVRTIVGKLFDQLVKEKQLTEEKLSQGLQEVLEFADDLEVDIPKIWDFFAEIMGPLVCDDSLPLSLYARLLKEANLGRKVAKNISKTLKECVKYIGEDKTCLVWEGSDMKWNELGLADDEIEEFLKDENLSFLLVQSPSSSSSTVVVDRDTVISPPFNPPYLKDLTSLFGSQNSTTDDILDWIEKQISQEESKSPKFVKTLAQAAVDGSSSGGDGNAHIFNDENFNKRLTLLKKWVDQDEGQQELILEGVQVGVALLKHPPKLLNRMLHQLYDVEVVSEAALVNWYKSGKESFGKGVAVQSCKRFFAWLESAETESDNETV